MNEDIREVIRAENRNFKQVLRNMDSGIGSDGNAWEGGAVAEDEFSEVVSIRGYKNVAVMGILQNDEAHSANLDVYVGQDIEQFYYASELSGEVVFEEVPDAPDWDSGTNYKVGDMVKHEVGGELNIYTCIKNHRDEEPGSAGYEEFWSLTLEDTQGEVIEVIRLSEVVPARFIQFHLVDDSLDYLKLSVVAKF